MQFSGKERENVEKQLSLAARADLIGKYLSLGDRQILITSPIDCEEKCFRG